jgi:hypothetical protein
MLLEGILFDNVIEIASCLYSTIITKRIRIKEGNEELKFITSVL